MKYEYKVEVKHEKRWWQIEIITTKRRQAIYLLKSRMEIFPNSHFRISRRPIGKWYVVKEV